jgi:hypothetical protein
MTKKLPRARAEVSGAALKNPKRYRSGPDPRTARPVGEPFPTMTPQQKTAWRQLAAEMPWLKGSHRVAVRLACIWIARMESGAEFGVSASQVLAALLSKLGATPTDEHRLNFAPPSDEDPADRFFH